MALIGTEAMRRTRRQWIGNVALVGVAAAAFPAALLAQGQPAVLAAPGGAASVNLNPKRVIFDRPGKSATISVASGGGSSGSFDVELIDRVMLPDGQIVPVTEAQDKPEAARFKSAKAYLVATPRRIRIAAGGGQAIRVRATPSAELAPGEYRSHLTVTGIPPADTGLTAEQAAGRKEGELSFRINSVLAISIPVILRVGPVDVRAGIENAAIGFETISPDGKAPPVRTAMLNFDLVRMGVNSLYGDLEVRGSRKGEEPIGVVRGIGVYPEIDRRQVKIALTRIPAAGEAIEIQFRDDDTSPGKILSKTSLSAP
ncbi:hypothetical protein [Rhizorhabdus dicambivorans]|uniref:Molecular chaperone n=1 Tax=Rhizorhabdus dicambivorans TaxID=1850238 RepID=A0A2A4G2L7_9SPHN|nr:hypothetical protein [Rhizorhabdus dicambivorans]ATE64992.1 hypothetical protein CMV14_11750 [Rhizorhabdus dicambivorans]PCE44266.1 hypothetical protein COO09_01135 [Rhizorhabdus dicambivorans]